MLSLKEMFGEQGHSARQETMRQIYNTKMAEGTSMREHCLKQGFEIQTGPYGPTGKTANLSVLRFF